MKIMLKYLKPFRGRMSVGLSIKIFGTLVELLLPYILSHILEKGRCAAGRAPDHILGLAYDPLRGRCLCFAYNGKPYGGTRLARFFRKGAA